MTKTNLFYWLVWRSVISENIIDIVSTILLLLIIGRRQVWWDILVSTLSTSWSEKVFYRNRLRILGFISLFVFCFTCEDFAMHEIEMLWQPSPGSSGHCAWSPFLTFFIFSAMYLLRQYAINLDHPKLVPGGRPVSCILPRLISSPHKTGGWENNRMCRTAAHRGLD